MGCAFSVFTIFRFRKLSAKGFHNIFVFLEFAFLTVLFFNKYIYFFSTRLIVNKTVKNVQTD